MTPVAELARYVTVEQAAHVVGVPTSRFRSSWPQIGVCRLAARRGLLQFHRQDVVRAALLVYLQGVFGSNNALAVELAKSLSHD